MNRRKYFAVILMIVASSLFALYVALRMIETTNRMVGEDRDEHGCIGSAGYSWCEGKQKCLRGWEEQCD